MERRESERVEAGRRLVGAPSANEPPGSYLESQTYSRAVIMDALRTLHDRGDIRSVVLNSRAYYGLPASMVNVEDLAGRIAEITNPEAAPKPKNRLNAPQGK